MYKKLFAAVVTTAALVALVFSSAGCSDSDKPNASATPLTSARDTSPPAIKVIKPTNMAPAAGVTINASYSDSGSGINTASLVVYLDGATVTSCTVGSAQVNCPIAAVLTEGQHTVKVAIADKERNTGTGDAIFTVDATGPSLSGFTQETSGSSGFIITFNYSDVSEVDANIVSFQIDGKEAYREMTATQTGVPGTGLNPYGASSYQLPTFKPLCEIVDTGVIKCSTTLIFPGDHTFTVIVKDSVGNETTFSDSFQMPDSSHHDSGSGSGSGYNGSGSSCDPNYSGCVPIDSDVDCASGSGDGPSYVQGPVTVIGTDIYVLDGDGDGVGCE